MLHDVVQRKKFYTLVLQKCLTRSGVNKVITIPGKRGYLSDIRNNGTTIINIYESTIEIE